MNFIKDLSVTNKFVVGFTVILTVVVAICVTVFLSLQAIRSAVAQNEETVMQLKAADGVLIAIVERQNAVRGFVGSGDAEFLKKIATNQDAYEQHIAELTEVASKDAALIEAVKVAASEVDAQEDAQVFAASDPATRAEVAASLSSTGRLTKVRAALKTYTDRATALSKVRSAALGHSQNLAQSVLLVGGPVTVLLALAMGWILSAAIGRPILNMTGAMRRLAAGDNSVEVPAVGRRDEIGAMACAVQTFKEAAVEKLRLEAAGVEQRRQADTDRQSIEAERTHAAAEQASVVDGLAQGLERLAAGGLTFRIGEAFPPAYEKLRADFNVALQQMQDTMREVAQNATGVRLGAGEISHASNNLSQRTEQQAANLEETAAALDQITATVKRTADGAGHARDAMAAARVDAERSGLVVRDAVSAMGEIERSAQQIGNIIGVIDEIAFQTNLLALNAGVEAARAGDAGRGFAVVAQEVRALAQRSADAAKEIKALISTSSQQVGQGVALVGETGKVLERIVTQVTQINGVVVDIAASAQEQATGLQQVNIAVNQMDQVTQQNAAMVEQATAASQALAGEADALTRLIGRFELGDLPQLAHASNARPAQRRAAR